MNQKSFLILLVLGVAIRLLQIGEPLLNAHLIRQTQTADWTYNALEEGQSFPFSAKTSWRPDAEARLVLEFPTYNHLVMALHRVGVPLDPAGKIVSIILWGLCFVVLQKLWNYLLRPDQTIYANLLFVFAPLGVFFGQAFMPEMLILLLALLMVWQLLRYNEQPSLSVFVMFAAIGTLGLMVKSLEVMHLYLVALFVFWKKHGSRMFLLPRMYIGAVFTAVCYISWLGYVNEVNLVHFEHWSAKELSKAFLGTWQERLDPRFYLRVVFYITCFIVTPIGLALAVLGVWKQKVHPVLVWWLLGLLVFYMAFGPRTAGTHSYYNLPSLVPICALFATGVSVFLTWVAGKKFYKVAVVTLIVIPICLGNLYLFRQDKVIAEAAVAIQNNSAPGETVAVRVDHAAYGYRDYPALAYYSKRKTWVITPQLGDDFENKALLSSKLALITLPSQDGSLIEKFRARIRGKFEAPVKVNWPPESFGYVKVAEGPQYLLFRKND